MCFNVLEIQWFWHELDFPFPVLKDFTFYVFFFLSCFFNFSIFLHFLSFSWNILIVILALSWIQNYKLREVRHILKKNLKKTGIVCWIAQSFCLLIFKKEWSKNGFAGNLRSLLQFIHCVVAFPNLISTLLFCGHLESGLAERLSFTKFFYVTVRSQIK